MSEPTPLQEPLRTRDKQWCRALTQVLDTRQIEAVTKEFNERQRDDSICSRSVSPTEATEPRAADAWLIIHYLKGGKTEREVVLSPLTDDTYMDEGDEAIPLYAAPVSPGKESRD